MNAEIQSTRSSAKFDNSSRQQIERLDMKEIATPTRNTEMVEEENTSTEDVIIKTELSLAILSNLASKFSILFVLHAI